MSGMSLCVNMRCWGGVAVAVAVGWEKGGGV